MMNKLIMLLLATTLFSSSFGMDFSIVSWKGHQVLLAEGKIEKGDSKRFEKMIINAPKLPHGVPVVLLNSTGGSVSEALKISNIMGHTSVHTVIPNKARCASACASILFIAGKYRTMEEGGSFGQHSCSTNGIQNQHCNEIVANHAIKHGVSHGSVNAFLKFVLPQEVSWLSRAELDCWDITHYPFSEESGFWGKPEPCFLALINSESDISEEALRWRVDFFGSGYRAFFRPVMQYKRDGQLNLWCSKEKEGSLLLSAEIPGDKATIANAFRVANISAIPVEISTQKIIATQYDKNYTWLTVEIPKKYVLPFLKKSENITITFEPSYKYDPIIIMAPLSESRKSLIFAANHCS